ncbi:DUF418 domain-containing protein [Piscibacillus sp. B03]|uniref:DUF418 domain-containing protein n=1 Tax=Piscibacillus sp. B03 TaxID=3457430 RepID=UPI003FCD1565
MEPVNPVTKRYDSIDAIRGFSLLGILIVNLLSFHSPHFMYGGLREFYSGGIDAVTLFFIDIFAQASFYPLFSLLFGIGIYMMYVRLKEKEVDAITILRRRMIILAGLGLIHGLFIWYGDILLTYGVIGLVSLLFLNRTNRSLLKWALSLLLIGTALLIMLMYPVRNEIADFSINHVSIEASYEQYTGGIGDVFSQNLADWKYANDPFMWFFSLFNILPMFLLGMFFYKNGWIKEPNVHKATIKKWLVVTFITFLVFKVLPYVNGNPLWFESAQDTIGGSALSIFFFLVGLLVFNGRNFQRIKGILSNVGRLSLTNYLMQSVIGVFIFYGIGLNLYGKLHAFTLIVIALVVFLLQIIFSRWYIQKFHYGPFEWLYRTFTYGQRQPFIKKGD